MDERELKIECLKIAATVTRDQTEVSSAALRFYEWITGPFGRDDCTGPLPPEGSQHKP
jgi:hypothetical protein